MKKITYIIIISLFVGACGSQTNKEKLTELKKERNELRKQLSSVNNEIAGVEKAIQKDGGKLPSKNLTYVKTDEAKISTFKHFLKIQGEITSDNNIGVPAETPGVVKKVFVEEGDEVKKGQKLAQLDASVIEKQLEELNTSYDLAKTVFERRKRLWDKEIGSEIQYLQAKNNKEALEKKIETVKEQLSKTTITSPLNGTIDDVLLKQGEMAAAGLPAFQVVKMSEMKIRAEISESYLNQVEKGNPVKISPATSNNTFLSEVKTVGKVINAENRTYMIEVGLPAEAKTITPNMIMDLEVMNYQNDNAIAVPVNVVQKTNNRRFLFVAEQKNGHLAAVKKWVTTGKTYKKNVEILEGLQPGEKVIVSGYQDISDGEKISVK